jgi:Arc/MetJ-type ribon-helix-helix transcriptional regulator
MNLKERLSASVDSTLIRAAEEAVKKGAATSVSAWVNDALQMKLEHERRLEALSAFVSAYENEHGEISADEMKAAVRRARGRAAAREFAAPDLPQRPRRQARS